MRASAKRGASALLLAFLPAILLVAVPQRASAQAGPPLLTNDPGTPGPKEWEINLGVQPVLRQGVSQIQLPQLDINYGVGERIQLTVEVPYVIQSTNTPNLQTGWANAFTGVKWRFLDNWHGWNVSTFPQLETGGPQGSVKNGIAGSGNRLLVPLEVQKNWGPMEFDFEAGYFFPFQGHDERILGFAAGHQFNKKFELIGEVYNDYAMGDLPHDTTWDMGGRYGFHKGLVLLFMAGRSFSGPASGQPTFLGYVGIQILLERNGRALHAEE